MSVTALKPYVGQPRDVVANFLGKQIVYASWDHHQLFAAPFLLCVPPQMSFRDLVQGVLVPLTQADPDAKAVDWENITWLKSNRPWKPDFDKSLTDNGIEHKEQIRFQTVERTLP